MMFEYKVITFPQDMYMEQSYSDSFTYYGILDVDDYYSAVEQLYLQYKYENIDLIILTDEEGNSISFTSSIAEAISNKEI